MGEYDLSPEGMAKIVAEFMQEGWVNIVGGCCGTTPEHIRQIAAQAQQYAPHRPSELPRWTRLSGTQGLTLRPDANFLMIGERTNVTGSPPLRSIDSQ